MRHLTLVVSLLAFSAAGQETPTAPPGREAAEEARYSKRHAVSYDGLSGFIERAAWDGLGLQEQLRFREICLSPESRREAGIDEAAWSALPEPEKGARALAAVKIIAGAELAREMERMRPFASAVGELPSRASRWMKEEFVRTVLFWPDQYRVAELRPAQARMRDLMTEVAVRTANELAYSDAHDSMGRALKRTAELRAAAAQAAPDPAALGKVFDGAGAGAKSSAVSAAGGMASGSAPGTVAPRPRQGPDGVNVPAEPMWSYLPLQPDGPKGRRWAESGQREREIEMLKEVIAGLKTPVEREVVRSVAEAQQRLREHKKRALEGLDRREEALESELAKGLSVTSRERLTRELSRLEHQREQWGARSEDITLMVDDLGEDTGAYVSRDALRDSEGRRKLAIVFNRRILQAPAKENPKDALRKIATHELTHVADNLNGAIESRPERYVEPRAYLNQALSFQEEGKPKGSLPELWGGQDHAQMAGDPLGWMHRALERVKGGDAIWVLVSTDDLQEPVRAGRWRLEWVYRKVALEGGSPGDEQAVRRRAADYGLRDEVRAVLVRVRNDPHLPEISKPGEFSRLALETAQIRDFIAWLKDFPPHERAALDREQREFFDRLARLEP